MRNRYRKGVFLVVYRKEKANKKQGVEKGKIKYLLLHRILHWRGWEFPKGGIEKGEAIKSAIRRELREETGLKPVKIINMKAKGSFDYPHKLKDRPGIKGMRWSLYAVMVKKSVIKTDRIEHSAYKWLSFREAYKRLKFLDKKRCLKIADKYLKSAKYAK